MSAASADARLEVIRLTRRTARERAGDKGYPGTEEQT